MINIKQFKLRHQHFQHIDSVNYPYTFDEFWKWKLTMETENEHILDDNHREETYRKLSRTLPRWQTYRGVPGLRWRETLKDSLERMPDAYDQIRSFNLLEFSEVPDEQLELIWHELGRVKDKDGNRNPVGYYYIIAICKPLIFLWGQTLAFDSLVQKYIPRTYNIPKRNRWNFNDWKEVMEKIQRDLRQSGEVIDSFREVSREKYGIDSIVPYGQFLDLYYWVKEKL